MAKYKLNNPVISFEKYLDIDYWLCENLRRVYALGLHKRDRKLRILDIGTGAAYFPYICRHFGHEVEAVDLPGNEMYNEIISAFGIKRYDRSISAFQDLGIPGKYDLVTAYMICFNCHKQPALWHIREWEYFLDGLRKNNLNPGGEVFLAFNAETPEEPVSKELLAYFAANGAKIDGSTVLIPGDYKYPAKP